VANKPEVVGVAEIAEMAGVNKSVVGNWITRGTQNFPKPYATLRSGTIYFKHEIEKWLQATGRKTK